MIHDISWPLSPDTTTWPETAAPRRELVLSIARGDPVDFSRWTIAAHAGTHVDAPSHLLAGGSTVERLPLEPFIGSCWVVDLAHIGGRHVRADDLDALVPADAIRVLVRTTNSAVQSADAAFRTDYVALTEDAADWLVANDVIAVGVDALSVEPFGVEHHAVHHRLLGSGVAIIEGLRLAGVPAGRYTLSCLPLALVGSDGAPARAALLPAS